MVRSTLARSRLGRFFRKWYRKRGSTDRYPVRVVRPRLEALEDRTLLSIGADVKTYIQDQLAAETASFTRTETINNAAIGNFLHFDTLTLTENATLTGDVWSGTVTLSASSATLFPGSSFGGSISSTVAGQDALTGTFTIGSASGTPDFTLNVPTTANLVMNLGEALSITARNVSLNFDSAGADNQTLAMIQTATVTSPQFSGMPTATLTNFAVRSDGFSFDALNLNSPSSANPSIGNFLKTTGVSLTVSNFNVSFGTTANPTPSLSGTVGISVSGLQLFPTGNFVQLQTTGVSASYNFGNFDGTDPTGQLTVTISGFQLTMGQALQLSAASDIVITPDQSVLATIPSLTLSSPQFSGLGTTTVYNLQIQQGGFSIGSLEWGTTSPVTIGDILHFDSATVDLSNFALQYGGTPSVSGSVSFNVSGAVLFPNVPVLDISVGSISGGFDFGDATSPGLMHVQIGNLDISLGDALTIHLGAADLTPGRSTMLHATDVNVTANLFAGLSLILTTFDLTQTGFSLNGEFKTTNPVNIGDFLSFDGVTIDVGTSANPFTVNTQATPVVSGSITATLGTMTLFPGNTAVTSTATGLMASYDFASASHPGQFSLSAATFSLSLFGQLTLAASGVTFTPGQDTVATIAHSMLTFAPLNGLVVTVDDLAIQKTGFTVASASATLTSDLTLGSLLKLTKPTITLTNLAYTIGGSLSVTVGFSATGASLHLGPVLDASVGQSSGDYNLATHALSMTLGNFSLSLAQFANVTATSVALSYVPADDGSSEMTVDAMGVEAFMGTGTGSGRVGVDVTSGTLDLAVFKSTSGPITYALDFNGTASILGLPANSINVVPGDIEIRKNTAGALSTAAGTSTLTGDAVSAVTISDGGAGYQAPPTVTFSGGGGTGATGIAVLTNGVVTSVQITDGGSGYTSAPTVSFSSPT